MAPGADEAAIPVRVRVRLFAVQRELARTREIELDLPTGATIEMAWTEVARRHPVLQPGRPFLRFARNGEYADTDVVLEDGDELACIPPVSGGGVEDRGPVRRILELSEAPFERGLADRLAAELATDADGATVTFVGRTRITPGTPAPGQEDEAARHAGRAVIALEYEALEALALAVLAEIADEAEARFGVARLAIVHRTGTVPLGDPSVIVVAAAGHRGAAFEAARYAIDELKARAPIWKAEEFEGGHVWIGRQARTASEDRS
jgi:molybdopterin synthase catalytic subunit